MPYIKPEERRTTAIAVGQIKTPGHLNYILTLVVKEYMRQHNLSYQTINDIVGAFEGAKLEFYRRIAVPYENAKLAENGDVYNGQADN